MLWTNSIGAELYSTHNAGSGDESDLSKSSVEWKYSRSLLASSSSLINQSINRAALRFRGRRQLNYTVSASVPNSVAIHTLEIHGNGPHSASPIFLDWIRTNLLL